MKFTFLAASCLLLVDQGCGLLSPMNSRCRSRTQQPIISPGGTMMTSTISTSSSSLRMSDFDFPSAMPDKPQLSAEQRMEESADQFIENMTNALAEGVKAPPELTALKEARASGADSKVLALRIYELMIERGMLYDEQPDTGTLTPTEFDIKSNLEVKEVKDEFAYLYKYGMMLMDRGLLTADEVKTAALDRLIKRTGLEPEEFDAWLGY